MLQGQLLFSQCISIELSVIWEKGYDIFNKDSTVFIPILNITYRNNCDTNYYFLKVSDSDNGLPRLLSPDNMYNENLKSGDLKREFYARHANRNFIVNIRGTPWYTNIWSVYSDTVDFHNKMCSFEFVNVALFNIYGYMNHDKSKKKNIWLALSDTTSENILGLPKDLFVFLKPGETYIDTYNLIAFKLLAANFTFLTDQDEIKNYFKTTKEEVELPKIVGEYYRYSGAFNTNKVTVCFGEK